MLSGISLLRYALMEGLLEIKYQEDLNRLKSYIEEASKTGKGIDGALYCYAKLSAKLVKAQRLAKKLKSESSKWFRVSETNLVEYYNTGE